MKHNPAKRGLGVCVTDDDKTTTLACIAKCNQSINYLWTKFIVQ